MFAKHDRVNGGTLTTSNLLIKKTESLFTGRMLFGRYVTDKGITLSRSLFTKLLYLQVNKFSALYKVTFLLTGIIEK